ncbi:MAG: DUF2339 domain-containing protein [Acidobacteriota bacterium]|nr:DUF2339 domain-containing protein [Acidobacteriota bacterium]
MADEDIRTRLDFLEDRLTRIENRLGVVYAPPAAEPDASPARQPARAPATTPKKSVESLIGAHWLNRVGIAALLIGVAFFLKYAFENEWIGPAARVGIGIGAGAALLVWSERFHRHGQRAFAHSLEVVAVGILYLSIWASSQTYTLISNAASFGAMAIVSIALVALAIRHQSEFLAGLALTSGFLTPVLLSTGVNREVALFSYISLLDVAALVLVALYPWVRALTVAFLGTLFLYIGWCSSFYSKAQMPRTVAFITFFLLMFAVVPLLRRWNDRGNAFGVLLVLPFVNSFVYFGELAWIIEDPVRLAKYAVALSAFFLVLAFALQLRGDVDLSVAHLAICLGFVTVAIPLQFHALWITIGWLAEAAALLLISRTSPSSAAKAFKTLGSFALAAGVFRLLFIDRFHPEHILFNMRALTYAIAVVIFSGIAISSLRYRKFATAALNVLALIALTAEISDAFRSYKIVRNFAWSALWMLYGAALMFVGFARSNAFLRWLALILLGLTIGKVFLYDLSTLERVYRILSFIALGVLLLAISFAYQKKWITIPDQSP